MMRQAKYKALIIFSFLALQVTGQVAFEEDFENIATGVDLTDEGYYISHSLSYGVNVSAAVAEDSINKFARMVASPSGAAKMQILKTIDVEPGKLYAFEVDTRGPYKRQTRIFSSDYNLLQSSPDYKPSTVEEESAWKKFRLTFLAAPGATQVNIGLYHYWSGTIDLDNIIVYETLRQTAYYVSSSEGNDDNFGTIDAPWKSLEKISAVNLLPGDTVLFKKGDRFDGHFVVNGSGNSEFPVLITAYGEGEKPIITGEVGVEGGGDYMEAILVENNDNLLFEGLEVQNERLVSRSGVRDTDAYGILVKNTGDKTMRNLVFRNMDIKNVFAVQPILDPDDFNTIQVSGLGVQCSKNTVAGKEKHIRDILVEHCFFGNLQRFGIQFKHSGGNTGIGNDSINRNMNIHIRNNEFSYNGGTGVLPNSTYNCLIENNIFDHPGASTDPRMPGRGSSIWNYKAINTIMQYNMCLSTRGYLDSYGIHIDNYNTNTFVQYNYMEDCIGGFVEILRGNKNAVYRFNVSVNDGWRKNPTWANSNKTIWVNADRWGDPENFAPSDGVYIYNNTVVIDSAYTTCINLDGKNMFVYNNIWSSTNGAGLGVQNTVVRDNGTPFFMSNNLFEGSVDQRFIDYDENPQLGSPMFTDTAENQFAFQLKEGSPAINNGVAKTGPKVPGAGHGVFMDVPAYPDVDLFGNPLDLAAVIPNIGVSNAYNPGDSIVIPVDTTVIPVDTTVIPVDTTVIPVDTTVIPVDTTVIPVDTTEISNITLKQEAGWLVYPQPAASKIHIQNNGSLSGETLIVMCNLRGEAVLSEKKYVLPDSGDFVLSLEDSIPNGIYFLNIQNDGKLHSRRIILYR